MRYNTGGVVLIVLGLFFLLKNLGLFDWTWLRDLWPVALILAGVALLLPRENR